MLKANSVRCQFCLFVDINLQTSAFAAFQKKSKVETRVKSVSFLLPLLLGLIDDEVLHSSRSSRIFHFVTIEEVGQRI